MTSVGIMASSVTLPSSVDVLLEPFNDFTTAPWSVTGSMSIVTGRTGTGARGNGTPSNLAHYTVPTISESPYMMVGFAFRPSALSSTIAMFQLDSDGGATAHIYVRVTTAGAIEVRLGGSAGAIIATSGSGVVVAATYVYVEVAAFMHDTAGYVTVRVNGTQVAAATNVDTKAGGTKATFDGVTLFGPVSGLNNIFDDLYVTMGPGATFKGSITIP